MKPTIFYLAAFAWTIWGACHPGKTKQNDPGAGLSSGAGQEQTASSEETAVRGESGFPEGNDDAEGTRKALSKPVGKIYSYKNRMSLQYVPKVAVTHPDAYKIQTEEPVYPTHTEKIVLDVINVDAPTAEPELFNLDQWNGEKWVFFPFIDNLVFAGVGRDLSRGDTLPEIISAWQFKELFRPNRYRVHFYVALNMYTPFELTAEGIRPVGAGDSRKPQAIGFRVLESSPDSIRVALENYTNLEVVPVFFPSVEEKDTHFPAHPLARSGSREEADWMRKYGSLQAGEALLMSIPSFWNPDLLTRYEEYERFKSGRLAPGTYKLGLLLEVYMTTTFQVK